jgi:hypothetical protein
VTTAFIADVRGVWRGRVWMADDFDELPDDIAEAFGLVAQATVEKAVIVSADAALRPYGVELIW